jgi:alpha-glucosidase/alpha-D-xyloside xylohydrolase
LSLAAIGAANAPLQAAAQPVELTVFAVSARTLRITLHGNSAAPIPADSVILRRTPSAPLLKTTGQSKKSRWGSQRVRISANPFTLSVEDRSGKLIQNLDFDPVDNTVAFRLGEAPLFGMGEGGPQYDRRNHEYTMRNGQFNPDQRIEGGRMPIPWIISPEGWGLFIHQPFGITSLKGPVGKFTATQPPTLPIDLFLVVAPEPADVLREYAELTGYPHLPPLWTLGYQQSHRTLESRDEVMDEAREFRSKRLPCDTMIYLGTGFCPSGWNTGHGSFRFNEKVFPDPAKMIEELHREHFHVVFHLTQPPENSTAT